MHPTPRIDAHQHLWHYTEAEYGWIGEPMRALRRDFLLPELRAAMRTAAVDGTVAVEARQTVEETRWLLRLAAEEGSPIRGVTGWLPIASDGFAATMEDFRHEPKLKALRHRVQDEPAGFLDGNAFNHGIAAMHGTGWLFELALLARQLPEVAGFVDRHPRQTVVLDHVAKPAIRAGGFATWRRDLLEIARRPHVCCKLSGMITETDWARWTPEELAPYFETSLEAFGPERLMIGTDWPVLTVGATYAQWWQTVEDWTSHLSPTERAAILGVTAVRVYGLEFG